MPKSLPIDSQLPASSLSHVFQGGKFILLNHKIFKNQQVSALNGLTKLLKLVKAEEKKYGRNRLLPYNNCYCWDLLVQQFFQAQLTIGPSQTHHNLFCNDTQSFGRDTFTAWNIV